MLWSCSFRPVAERYGWCPVLWWRCRPRLKASAPFPSASVALLCSLPVTAMEFAPRAGCSSVKPLPPLPRFQSRDRQLSRSVTGTPITLYRSCASAVSPFQTLNPTAPHAKCMYLDKSPMVCCLRTKKTFGFPPSLMQTGQIFTIQVCR